MSFEKPELNDKALPLKRKPGRPKGSAQQNFLTLRYWFTHMQDNMSELKPYQRALLSVKMMQTLLAHDKHLEKDPNKRDRNKEVEVDEAALLRELDGDGPPQNKPV